MKKMRRFCFKNIRFSYTVRMNELLKNAKEIQRELIEHRRYLHENAECGFALTKTLGFIEKQLKDMGYTPKKCGKAGLTAEVGDGGKRVLLRADIDGLPIKEKSGLSYACKNGNMHACGHDLHTAMLLGAAKLLKANEGRLKGSVRLLFQPAEELLEGAKNCIEAGVLEGVDCAVMLHVLTALDIPMGEVIVSSEGVSAPAADYFSMEIKGKGCHGSSPWRGVDPLTVAAHILLGLQALSARELSPAQTAVLTVGSIQTGEAANAISNAALLHGTLRAFDEEVRSFVKRRMETIVKQTAKAFRASAKVKYGGGCPTLVNDGELSKLAYEAAKKLLGEERVATSKGIGGDVRKKEGGSEDFAYISHAVPSVMIALSAGERSKGFAYPLHHPKVKFDENALPIGAALYAELAQKLLEKA